MAQHVEVTITDDIDGSPGAETVLFGIGRTNEAGGRLVQYEIDLSPKNAAALVKFLDKYKEHGRKVAATRQGRVPRTRTSHDGLDTAAVRAWAAENNIPVSGRGRIAAEIVEKYQAAH